MGYTNSPSDSTQSDPVQSVVKRTTITQIFLQAFRWLKGLIEAHKLPLVASKACEIVLSEGSAAHQAKCRRILQTRLELEPSQLHRFFHTTIGRDVVAWVERFVHLSGDRSSTTFKDLLLQMAADPDGLSLLSVLRRFPDPLQLNVDQLVLAAKQIELFLQETDAATTVIQTLSHAEAIAQPDLHVSELPDIRLPGAFDVKRFTWVIETTSASDAAARSLKVVCYQPYPWPTDAVSVIVQSHGLASSPTDLAIYAAHLASYGYFVVAPHHPGSDAEHVRNMLAGHVDEVFQLSEFVDRPLDISAVLDELERRNKDQFEGRLNLESVGAMGYSFGAYTALALAGANIHFDTLELACNSSFEHPNLSLLLQCQALGLPRQPYHLQDRRIRAVLSMNSVGSEVFGAEGIKSVQVPMLLIAGSHDATAPLICEQIRIFRWLSTPHRYLALMQGKSHIHDMQRLVRVLDLHLKLSPQTPAVSGLAPFDSYTKALSLAFFNWHLGHRAEFSAYLTANYATQISQPPNSLWLISQQSSVLLQDYLQHMEQKRITDVMDIGTTLKKME